MRWTAIVLLCVLWLTRLLSLEVLPLHNDEGLHLTRAVEVWNGHPFWAISDGKIINHWLIAAFYPQGAPVFAGRVATIFLGLIGLAAGYALARRLAGSTGALLAGALWLFSPYLFFYERLAFSDAQAGALVMLAVWLAFRLSESGQRREAVLTGLALGAALLFKFTAAPFVLSVALVVLLKGQVPRQRRWLNLVIIAGVVAAGFVVPLGYLLLKGNDLFAIAFGWLGTSSGQGIAFFNNLQRLWAQLTGFGTISWVVLLIGGLALLLLRKTRSNPVGRLSDGQLAVIVWALPLLVIMILGREVLSRHYVVALPLALTLGGAGLGLGVQRFKLAPARNLVVAAGIVALVFGFVPLALTAYTNPAALPLPADVRYEHITSHSSGYGLREAAQQFPTTLTRPDLPIIGSLFPDSCRRANFYAPANFKMVCTDAPGLPEIEAALRDNGAVYVLADNAPLIGVDVRTLDSQVTCIAAYPRPGETEADASVVLWLVEPRS
ncbi:MAG TPA: glycosyltransferase family 39 protein [Phototrophicaceae bacterium]|nr:glycosyltransferase family 39 protein [Phototrophicaceae bacterium]